MAFLTESLSLVLLVISIRRTESDVTLLGITRLHHLKAIQYLQKLSISPSDEVFHPVLTFPIPQLPKHFTLSSLPIPSVNHRRTCDVSPITHPCLARPIISSTRQGFKRPRTQKNPHHPDQCHHCLLLR
ncbi:hypothetical protein QBC45DRAFT_190255 [Copromyces sp. CBS 386.78]|nr:hypothetical protein QBC45DRAFT_190255 [Copromyces sp. CBS 386.78]